jgi:hypothetical protein
MRTAEQRRQAMIAPMVIVATLLSEVIVVKMRSKFIVETKIKDATDRHGWARKLFFAYTKA